MSAHDKTDVEERAPSVTMPATLVAEPSGKEPFIADSPAKRYAEIALLGEGGMGKVHLCHDARIGREVAMKVILPDLAEKTSTRARFLREASVQGQLEHPSIVPVHDIGVTPEGSTFFTMKCVRGATLEQVLAEIEAHVPAAVERFTTRRLLQSFVAICMAVDFAHSRGVVHRDLKPSNVMLGSFGEVYLLDWGIAKLAAETDEKILEADRLSSPPPVSDQKATPKTAAGSILGTLAYMAPEQMTGEPASARSDVFSLGAILFEILTGQPLRDEDATYASLLRGQYEPRCSVRAPERHVPPELEAICLKAMANDPDDRYASAREMSEQIETYLEGDRDVVRRREQAAEHVTRARGANEPTRAMRELGAALALDPDNVDARQLVVEVLTQVPKELPPEVRERVEKRAHEAIVQGVRMWPIMLASWIVFVPLLYWAGIHDFRTMIISIGLMGMSTALGLIRSRRRSGDWLEYASFATSAIAMASTGSVFGPFVLVPTLPATFATVAQLHPKARSRRIVMTVQALALVGGVIASITGLVPSVPGISATTLLLPGTHPEPHDLRVALILLLMNVASMVTAALTVSEARSRLSTAEERLLVYAWQVKAMMPSGVGERESDARIPAWQSKRKGR